MISTKHLYINHTIYLIVNLLDANINTIFYKLVKLKTDWLFEMRDVHLFWDEESFFLIYFQ